MLSQSNYNPHTHTRRERQGESELSSSKIQNNLLCWRRMRNELEHAKHKGTQLLMVDSGLSFLMSSYHQNIKHFHLNWYSFTCFCFFFALLLRGYAAVLLLSRRLAVILIWFPFFLSHKAHTLKMVSVTFYFLLRSVGGNLMIMMMRRFDKCLKL